MITADCFEDIIVKLTKPFAKDTSTREYQELSYELVRAHMFSDVGPALGIGVWMWREWMFGGNRSRFRTFRHYIRWRIRFEERRAKLHSAKYCAVTHSAYRGLITIFENDKRSAII